MRKVMLFILVICCLFVVGCADDAAQGEMQEEMHEPNAGEMKPVEDTENMEPGSWLPPWDSDNPAPWESVIYLTSSEDGMSFDKGELFLEEAGVPHLLQDSQGRIIASYVMLSTTEYEYWEVIAYSISEDNGETWSGPHVIEIENPPTYQGKPADPVLVELEDGSLRLYFTIDTHEDEYPRLASAVAADIGDTFVYEEGVRASIDAWLLDPAVIFFDGMWHYYTYEITDGTGEDHTNYHFISEDGLTFERQDDFTLDMRMLGQVIEADDGLRFYGTAQGSVSAFSADGYMWEMEDGQRAQGADPGVVQLGDGSYLMMYVALS